MSFNPLKPFANLKLPHARAGVTTLLSYGPGHTYHTAQGTRAGCEQFFNEMKKDYPQNPYQTQQIGEITPVEGKPGVFTVVVRHRSSSD